jgi:hypothetical protein
MVGAPDDSPVIRLLARLLGAYYLVVLCGLVNSRVVGNPEVIIKPPAKDENPIQHHFILVSL